MNDPIERKEVLKANIKLLEMGIKGMLIHVVGHLGEINKDEIPDYLWPIILHYRERKR